MCPEILVGAAKWETLWEPVDLFSEFKQFVQITARAPTVSTMSAFSGLVQSTLRVFVSGFPPDFHGVPFPKVYEMPRNADDPEAPHRRAFFFGIKVGPSPDQLTDFPFFAAMHILLSLLFCVVVEGTVV